MMVKNALVALMGLAVAAEAATIHHTPTMDRIIRGRARNSNGNGGKNAASSGSASSGSSTCLAANALQTGSESTGQANGVAADGQTNSATDNANFINFCSGKTLTNGLQVKTGSCNGVVMGEIPATEQMVSTVILSPKNLDSLPENTTFNITLNVANMALGSFTNATSTYYSAPQTLDSSGRIIGHTHVTVQDTGSDLNPTTPLDGTKFAFFKGINDAGDNGQLTTEVSGGLPAGNYRVCTMAGASNHQPVLMAVAQRGAQDDCKYFTVTSSGSSDGGSSSSSSSSSSSTNNAAGSDGSSTTTAASTSSSSTSSSSSSSSGSTGGCGGSSSSATTTSASVSDSTAIGGIAAPAVTSTGDSSRPFGVDGDTFVNESAAKQRACSVQNNQCADAVNSGKVSGKTVADCNAQEQACNAA